MLLLSSHVLMTQGSGVTVVSRFILMVHFILFYVVLYRDLQILYGTNYIHRN